MPSAFTQQRLAHLESLAAELPERGLVGRMLGGDDPVLWVWHPGSGRQTIVFATPAKDGWLFLWSPAGQESADDPGHVADSVGKLLGTNP
ncbi:hypothetical protein SAMN05216276_103947 [Streptosporangium subroseum]|uniref:Uncharacterized protein n=1 Tax=Streptosporangium subroseum TaxID=106412 RepID=A0A239MD10_9ACTN|nr:hypothetical protein [Streptosporangium subroseum]SNT39709.1 hypothetical protein SAMN05216276_103947 [Streptosporangium subroseum]